MQQHHSNHQMMSTLISILKYEKEQLMKGRYTDLPAIAKQKEIFLSKINALSAQPKSMTDKTSYQFLIKTIKSLAKETEFLLSSAKNATIAAQIRIQNIKESHSIVGTYTEGGDKLKIHEAAATRRKIA